MPESMAFVSFEILVSASFFPALELFTCLTRRRCSDGPALVRGSPGVGDTRGVELGYPDDWGGR